MSTNNKAHEFNLWLSGLPMQGEFAQISTHRAYAHDEAQYDKQYGIVDDFPAEGAGLCELLNRHTVDTTGPALEIGCGTGKLTSGMARECPWPLLVVTDPSPTFLRITRDRLRSLGRNDAKLRYAILRGDDLGNLPSESFSTISLRSTLHHILDVDAFISSCARCLRPGGALAMGAEPCVEGYVLMGAFAQVLPSVLSSAGVVLTVRNLEQIEMLQKTMQFYCRQDVDKTEAEDKHLFHPHELGLIFAKNGLEFHFHPNVAFAGFAGGATPSTSTSFFRNFILTYLKYCMSFDVELVNLIEKQMKPFMEYIETCYSGRGNSPHCTGVFIGKKKKVDASQGMQ
jgi:ubiquinone/menaquinone biosynthesis C-methylase UbiE